MEQIHRWLCLCGLLFLQAKMQGIWPEGMVMANPPGGPVIRLSRELPNSLVLPADPLEPATERVEARELRHRHVEKRRAGTVIMVRCGASGVVPANSLDFCARAMDYGADGVIVDLRATRDGVPVVFSDASLEGLTEGFGTPEQFRYRELLALHGQRAFGRPLFLRPLTFAALLNLARERSMLLWLNLQTPGLLPPVKRLLDSADAWDMVVAVRGAGAQEFEHFPDYRPLTTKPPGLTLDGRDMDPVAVKRALLQPGQILVVNDPRVAAQALARPLIQPVPFTKTYLLTSRPMVFSTPATNEFNPLAYLRISTNRLSLLSTDALLSYLTNCPAPAARSIQTWSTEKRVVERAWIAQRLANGRQASARVVRALEKVIQDPLHSDDPIYQGVDAASAARALGRLGAVRSTPTLIAVLRRYAADGRRKSEGPDELSIGERVRMAVFESLGDLRCRGAKRFLQTYVGLSDVRAQAFGQPHFAEATRALLRQRLDWTEITALLHSPNTTVRGTAILECLDGYTEERGMALQSAAPWALQLPRPVP
jgi:hypothetical protein